MQHDKSKTPEGMTLVPAGEFIMGCRDEELMLDSLYPETDYLAPSRPQRVVHLDAFFIDIHPVTNAQYREFLLETDYPAPYEYAYGFPDEYDPYNWDRTNAEFPPGTDNMPVVYVTWYDALAYCEWAGKRLPTEAEWEKAARGVDGRPYPWGWEQPSPHLCHYYPNDPSTGLAPHRPDSPHLDLRPVDALPNGRSPYGVLDMLGNVEEWCVDWYTDDYYQNMPLRNPKGPTHGEVWDLVQAATKENKKYESEGPCGGPIVAYAQRVVRGCGRFWDPPHAALRSYEASWSRNRGVGFRCAKW